jgi:uncharacterized protein with FMN-binding domain
MRRTPIVIAATVVGLIGVLEFHSRTSPVSFGAVPSPGSAATASPATTAPSRGSRGSTAPARRGSPSQMGGTRTAVGPAVNYNFGVLSVTVTVSGTRIIKVGIASLNDGGNPRSQFIDQQAIPVLEHQALQTQSANIQGVSGASYTSSGFAESLQTALHQLGMR